MVVYGARPFFSHDDLYLLTPYAKKDLAMVSIEIQLIYYANSAKTTEALQVYSMAL